MRVVGMREFRRDLKRADAAVGTEIRHGLNDIAVGVIPMIRTLMQREFTHTSPDKKHVYGALEGSLRARSSQSSAAVVGGFANRVKHAGWWEFGGNNKRWSGGRGMNRRFVKDGRTMYPAVNLQREFIAAEMEHLIDRLAARV